jgi:hypothetical protein
VYAGNANLWSMGIRNRGFTNNTSPYIWIIGVQLSTIGQDGLSRVVVSSKQVIDRHDLPERDRTKDCFWVSAFAKFKKQI